MYWETKYPYDSLHCDTGFISVIENQAHNIAEDAWKIPWTEEPGGLQSRGSCKRVRYY